jgi:hypothetical protein
MKNHIVSKKLVLITIAAELLIVVVTAWIAAGFPGLRHDDGPPLITIQLAPRVQTQSLVRAHSI